MSVWVQVASGLPEVRSHSSRATALPTQRRMADIWFADAGFRRSWRRSALS